MFELVTGDKAITMKSLSDTYRALEGFMSSGLHYDNDLGSVNPVINTQYNGNIENNE